jgi:hypothetical protein
MVETHERLFLMQKLAQDIFKFQGLFLQHLDDHTLVQHLEVAGQVHDPYPALVRPAVSEIFLNNEPPVEFGPNHTVGRLKINVRDRISGDIDGLCLVLLLVFVHSGLLRQHFVKNYPNCLRQR